MYSDADTHMAELKKLYDQLHKNDAPPANKDEQQAALVLDSIKAMLMLMVQNHVDSNVVELSLFYHWFRLATLVNRCQEADFERWSSDLDCIMQPLIERLKQIASQINDAPSEQMAALGSHLEAIKSHLHSLRSDAKLDDPRPHVEAANRGIHGLIAVLMTKHNVNPVLIQNTLLYYWLRTTTINHNVDESMFQKWERNWEAVVEHVDLFFKEWLSKNSCSPSTPDTLRKNTSGKSNVITFLPPLTFNEHFLRAFTAEDAPCAALGIVETAGKENGFIALRTEGEIGNQQGGFELGTELLGNDSFAMLHLILNFSNDHVYDVLLNLGAAATKRVMRVWEATGDYFFFVFKDGGMTAFHQKIDEPWYEYNYFGVMENADKTQPRYDGAVDSFKNNRMEHGLFLDLNYQNRVDFLDLKDNRFEVKPAR
jgi:hypothetical protein